MIPNLEQRVIPPRGARGSNQAIIRAMQPAEWVLEDGRRVLKGDSYLWKSKSKANSFWASARKIGFKVVRRSEAGGTRCWVLLPKK